MLSAALGLTACDGIVDNVMDYHTHTIEAAEVAREAEVDKLVLTHIIPPLPNAISKRMFMRGMSDHFDGEIVVAEDGMRFHLEPKSQG